MSKNLCVVTLGTRDLQLKKALTKTNTVDKAIFLSQEHWGSEAGRPDIELRYNKDFPDFYSFASPRVAGAVLSEILCQNFNHPLWEILALPIVSDLLEKKVTEGFVMVVVFTDQKDAAEEHRRYDTLFFKDILKAFVQRNHSSKGISFEEICFYQDVVNIDALFKQLNEGYNQEVFDKYSSDSLDHVYLFMQGGIDQINMALTLRLMEQYKGKVRQIQKPEKSDLVERNFPSLFLRRLNRDKILDRLQKYDFSAIKDYLDESEVHLHRIAEYADLRLNRNHEELLKKDWRIAFEQELGRDYRLYPETLAFTKIQDIYLDAKVDLLRKREDGFVIKLQIATENFCITRVKETEFGKKFEFDKYYHKSALIPTMKDALIAEIRKKLGQGIKLNDWILSKKISLANCIFNHFIETGKIRESQDYLGSVKLMFNFITNEKYGTISKRNLLIHSLDGCTREDLEIVAHKVKLQNLNEGLQRFDKVFVIEKYGFLDKLKEMAIREVDS
jgi:hypothetical protein